MTLESEIERIRNTCIGCGKCSKVCPSLKHGGLDPMEVMMGGDEDVSTCISCGNCSRACRRSDPYTVMKYMIALANGIHVSETFRSTGYAMPVAEDIVEPDWKGDDVYIMPGCVVKAKTPYVLVATAAAMDAIGVGASELPRNTCCMHPVQFSEMPAQERRGYKTAMGESAGGRRIVTLCAGCSDELEGAQVDAEHAIPFLFEHLGSLPRSDRPLNVGIEPGCSAMPFKKEMRAVVEAMGHTVVNSSMGCCGKSTSVAAPLMREREEECSDADWIVVGCPMCQFKFDTYEDGKPVMHIMELVAYSAGRSETLGRHIIRPDGF